MVEKAAILLKHSVLIAVKSQDIYQIVLFIGQIKMFLSLFGDVVYNICLNICQFIILSFIIHNTHVDVMLPLI